MGRSYHGVHSLRPAVTLARTLATVPRTIKDFGGYRNGQWVDTVPAEYTGPETDFMRALTAAGKTNEAAWLHGLKAAFDARVVEGLDNEGDYEQGALL